MASSTKTVDPAFQGAGQKPGLEIWRIENFQPVPLPKSDYGKFYMGDSYIVLQTTPSKGSGGNLLDIHFWIGRDTSQDEKGTAAIKTVELDAALGARAVQHRELQGHESDKFLSYFKPCMVPLEGGIASGFKTPEEEVFESRLYTCKGTRVVRMKQVPCARSSLNHDDVFILDSEEKIYQFNGANSSIQERAKALEAIQFLKEKYHKGTCDVAIVDDGKLDTDSDSGEFWVLLGGYAPIGKKVVSEDDVALERTPAKLYSINDGAVNIMERELSKGLLEKDKCYLLDCGSEVFVWVGRATQVEKRKAACQAAEDFLVRENRPEHTHITRLIQGYETHSFKSNFSSWPAESTTSSSEEGKGKVAALLAKQGVVKGMKKNAAVNEEVPPLLEGGGKIEAWCINGSDKTPLPEDDIGKFYCGDCYIILYTYHLAEKKDNYYLCCWLGTDSLEEDRKTAIRLATAMTNSLKGRPVQGRIFQGKEPPQFIALFQPMVVLKGGLSSGYKETIAAQGLPDETYTPDCVALFEISGTSVHNNKAIQIEAVATSLNSTKGFLLQAGSSMFTWLGKQSTYEQKQLAAKVSEFLKPGVAIKHANEGTESSSFWLAIGGKKVYVSKKVTSEVVRDPHLFTYSINEGKFRVDEVHNFSQDDLLTEDMMILDTHAEVFIWVGQSVDAKEKQSAFDIGQRYIELAASLEDLSPNVALFKVTEGNEPSFFTANFSWDPEKANVQGNSFQRKASLLGFLHSFGEEKFSANNGGATQRAAALAALNSALNSSSEKQPSQEKSNESSQGGPRQRAEALAALNSALNAAPPPKPSVSRGGQGTQRTAAVAALSSFMSADKQKRPGASPSRSPPPEANPSDEDASDVKETGNVSENDVEQEEDSFYASIDTFYSYDQLKAHSENPITTGIDSKRREAYLSNEDFKTIFGVTKGRFSKMPKWKQDMLKKKFNLF